MIASETCRCGATITLEHRGIVPYQLNRFQDNHAACRAAFVERKPASRPRPWMGGPG